MEVYEMGEYDYNNEYEYDVKESHSTFHWEELSPVLVVYGITFCLGLCGNSLIVYATYRYRRMQSVTNVLLASLASSDLLLIVFCIPVKVAKLFSYTWALGSFLCKCVHYIQNVSMICSVLTLTAISIERYYAIVHPMRAKYICTISQARRVILLTWALSIILAIPILFVQIQMSVGEKIKAFWCVRDWENRSLWISHEVYMLVLVLLIPFCIMTLAYSLICWEVWNVMERRNLMTSRHALSRNHTVQHDGIQLNKLSKPKKVKYGRDDTRMVKQVICMLVAVVFLFAICWGPVLIDNVLKAYKILPKIRTGPLKYMGTTFHLMAYFNSCINPVIYGFMSKNFRDSFKTVLCCYKEGAKKRHASTATSSIRHASRSGSQTRNTSIR
ncbi:PREDICTED: pyroglutamylated RFamide peptide receptor-like [Nicrophorus vespilloides]|uniref:Pyroglutamylated RFamide peptide receptor-like n=1 Tax=Nicrophorus vespilloides TaxID=110193 RepID=A0ABM1N2G6_NICVS|nr:PREDICTED: pyroglutamylated RFamide peptide receptor-like [Nicrophorus vespilloides]